MGNCQCPDQGQCREKETLREFLRDVMLTLVQSETNKVLKERKGQQRQRRSVAVAAAKNAKQIDSDRRRRIAAEIGDDDADSDSSRQKKITNVKATQELANSAAGPST